VRWLKNWFWPRIRQTAEEWSGDEAALLSAATSYYAALAFFPLLLVLIAVFGYVLRLSPSAQSAEEELIAVVAQTASPSLATRVKEILGQVKTGADVGGPIGLIALLVVVTGLFDQIDNAFARIWRMPARPASGIGSFVRRTLVERAQAFLMFLVLGLLVIGVFFTSLALAVVQRFAEKVPAGARTWEVLGVVITLVLNTLILATIYKAHRGTRVFWRDVAAGAFLAALVWEVGRQVLALFVIGTKYSAYGVVGSFIALMVWFYYAVSVMYFGAEFVKVSSDLRKQGK
jgi:membrane protein